MKHTIFTLIFLTACSSNIKTNLNTWTKPQAKLITVNEISIMPITSNNLSISDDQLAAINQKLESELNLKTSLNIKKCVSDIKGDTLVEKAIRYTNYCKTQGTLYGLLTKIGNSEASFKLWLYSAKHKNVIWTATFENSQPVLTDNLFGSGGQGVKFSSSEKIIYQGLAQVATKLEESRVKISQ